MDLILLYLDPGSGSMIVQALIAGGLAFMMFFKNLRYKITSFFSKTKANNDDDES